MLTETNKSQKRLLAWVFALLLTLILLAGAALRFTGVNWDSGARPHPDERFLTMVETALQPKKCLDPALAVEICPPEKKAWLSLSDYFNTATSTLNPHNRGYAFFVYGTLPMVLVRYTAELLNKTGYGDVTLVGRGLSALADLGTILLLYFIVARVYNRKVALIASAFSALAVLQIQQSHYFTTDTFTNFFLFMAVYFAVRVGEEVGRWQSETLRTVKQFLVHPLFCWSAAFGAALGMAAASKINAIVAAVLLPAAFFLALIARRKSAEESGVESERRLLLIGGFLLVGALTAFLAFRIFQPYAFSGPGFLGIKPNPAWVANIREQRAQANGDADLPFALQWARRSHLFSFINLTLWGFGLPFGILAWSGFIFMAFRILKGEWRQHLLLWGWTAAYFLWQSLQFNPTMRYQLPVYPLLALMAGWIIVCLWESGKRISIEEGRRKRSYSFILRFLSASLGIVGFLLTVAWALAFTSIYTRTETRVDASRWIYQNVPGPINLRIQTSDGLFQQPIPLPSGFGIKSGSPYDLGFTARSDGQLSEVFLPHVAEKETVNLAVSVLQNPDDLQPLIASILPVSLVGSVPSTSQTLTFDPQLSLAAQQIYFLKVELLNAGQVDICSPMRMSFQTSAGEVEQVLDAIPGCEINPQKPYLVQFTSPADGTLVKVIFDRVLNTAVIIPQTLSLSIAMTQDALSGQNIARATATLDFASQQNAQGASQTLTFEMPVSLVNGQTYYLRLETSGGTLTLAGAAPINETDWDMGLPFPLDGYDGFGGLYQGGLNLQLYWDDNADKLARFESTLDAGDYIFISSNRQWATTTRVPERYPLTTVYYRSLIGCPPEKDIIWCYNVATPGMFQGSLGYDLVKVVESFPTLHIPGVGDFTINDQFAEEAFTVYDHSKVLIFQKADNYDPQRVSAILGAVDLTSVVRLTPRQASNYKSLMLSSEQSAVQKAGGTWSQLFNYADLQNRYPVIGLVIWYLFIFLLGVVVYPLVRLGLPGLADRGYPFARLIGMVVLGYLPWLAGSFNIPYTRTTIGLALGVLLLMGAGLAYFQRAELRQEWKEKGGYFLLVECLFLAFFIIDLLIRIGNPDLWHPSKGGERPMEFSYFNAVIKSTTFPPYDPWYAGGYINYYYYGYIILGTVVKFLGIVPSIAYNFVLPTLFAIVAMAAFSVGWNLLSGVGKSDAGKRFQVFKSGSFLAGIASSAGMLLLGNLGILRLYIWGFQRLAAPDPGTIFQSGIFQRISWAFQGFTKVVLGANLPFGPGDWYWFPSRVIPAPGDVEPITEFPLFSFLWSDLHAHLMALPLTILVIAWGISFIFALRNSAVFKKTGWLVIAFGAFIIGALKPTNTWDMFTYLPLAGVAVGYAIWRYYPVEKPFLGLSLKLTRLVYALGAIVWLVLLSQLFYQPFARWFSPYSGIDFWKGSNTPLGSYFIHWGLFLFVIISWLAWETHEWMASTPASSLNKLRPFQVWIEILFVLLLAAVLSLLIIGVSIAWLVVPLAAWAAILILRPGLSDMKRAVLFMTGTALTLTLVVEVVVMRGDVGRMNTVFKLYYQVWTLLALSAAAAFVWLLPGIRLWSQNWRNAWQVTGVLLLSIAALFTIFGTADKIRDRWIPTSPHSLDSITYMNYARYSNFGVEMDLSEDYRAIRWIQDNIQGSPVIVEANTVEYQWGSRYTIYTGLPGVVGWNWHQRQQRVLMSNTVFERVAEIAAFYNTTDGNAALVFLRKYNVQYIILGQYERAAYPGEGLAKFEFLNGTLWNVVYRDGQTAIYEVVP